MTTNKGRIIAARKGKSRQDIREQATENHRRQVFLEGLRADIRLLRSNADMLKEYEKETDLWDNTLADGLIGK